MGNVIPIWELPIGSHIGPSRGGSKSHQKNRSSKNSLKIDKMSEHVPKSASRGYPGGDQRSNIFRSFSVLGPWVTFWCQGWSQNCQNVPKWYPKGPKKVPQEQLFRDFASSFGCFCVTFLGLPGEVPKAITKTSHSNT